MANNYPVVRLGEVVDLQNGYAFKSKDWQEEGIPVIKIANVKDGYIDLDRCAYISPSLAEEKSRFMLSGGDALIGMTGYVGSVGMLDRDQSPCVLNQRVGRFTSYDTDRVDRWYLFSFFRLQSTKEAWERLATGSAQPNISPSKILSIELPLPSIEEQSWIASSVGSLHKRAAANRKMNMTLEETSQLVMQRLLYSAPLSFQIFGSGND